MGHRFSPEIAAARARATTIPLTFNRSTLTPSHDQNANASVIASALTGSRLNWLQLNNAAIRPTPIEQLYPAASFQTEIAQQLLFALKAEGALNTLSRGIDFPGFHRGFRFREETVEKAKEDHALMSVIGLGVNAAEAAVKTLRWAEGRGEAFQLSEIPLFNTVPEGLLVKSYVHHGGARKDNAAFREPVYGEIIAVKPVITEAPDSITVLIARKAPGMRDVDVRSGLVMHIQLGSKAIIPETEALPGKIITKDASVTINTFVARPRDFGPIVIRPAEMDFVTQNGGLQASLSSGNTLYLDEGGIKDARIFGPTQFGRLSTDGLVAFGEFYRTVREANPTARRVYRQISRLTPSHS